MPSHSIVLGKGSVEGRQHCPTAAKQLEQERKALSVNAYDKGCQHASSISRATGSHAVPRPFLSSSG